MGTHATTVVMSGGTPVVNMYRHYDGYADGHGSELANYLSSLELVNGLPVGADRSQMANGMDDLAALMVAHFKNGPGDFYLVSLDREEEYHYTVYEALGTICIRLVYEGKVWYDGPAKGYIEADIAV